MENNTKSIDKYVKALRKAIDAYFREELSRRIKEGLAKAKKIKNETKDN